MTSIMKAVSPYIIDILGTLLTVLAGYLGFKWKRLLDTDTKQRLADITVKYVEQVAKLLGSDEKLALAKTKLAAFLKKYHINITEDEITTLIEAACTQFTTHYKTTTDDDAVTDESTTDAAADTDVGEATESTE